MIHHNRYCFYIRDYDYDYVYYGFDYGNDNVAIKTAFMVVPKWHQHY